jgi:P22 coat protein - gene protein 5
MSNTLATSSLIAKESLAILQNMLSFSTNVNRDYESEWGRAKTGAYAPGQTINIKKPPRYSYRSGRTASLQGTTETTVPLTLTQGGVDLNFTGAEMTYSIDQLRPKLAAAMAAVANQIDLAGLSLVQSAVYNQVGTPGTTPATAAAVLSVNQRLDELGAPRDKQRALILNPAANAGLVGGLSGFFNDQKTLGEQYKSGMMVDSLGMTIAVDQNCPVQTQGTQAATGVTVNGASQTGSTINVNTASVTGTIKAGSVITFAGVFAVNPQSRVSTGSLAQFVVTADVAISATSIAISPAIVATGVFQNVTASPANTAAVTIAGAPSIVYPLSVGFHKDAFTLAMVPMYVPAGGDSKGFFFAAQESFNGFTMKMTQGYDITNDNYITRFDVLFGWAATYPELAVRLAG